MFDAGDIYTAGLHFGLIPVMQEVYNTRDSTIGEPEYYAVAVAYQGDPDTELTYLKGMRIYIVEIFKCCYIFHLALTTCDLIFQGNILVILE